MKKIFFVLMSAGFLFLTSCEDELQKNNISGELKEYKELKNSHSEKQVLNFRAPLNGSNEVPAVLTDASGIAIFKLSKDGTELSYKLNVEMIDNVIMSHIHIAPEGTNGPVAVWLFPAGPPPSAPTGPVDGTLAEGVITSANLVGPLSGMSLDDLVEKFYMGHAYVNVHTTDFPAGEIRGQIFGNMPQGKSE